MILIDFSILEDLKNGITFSEKELSQFDFNYLIHQETDGIVNYKNKLHDLYIKYHDTEWDHKIFDFISKKQNANRLYIKIKKIENEFNNNIFQKIKKLKWTDKAIIDFWDYQCHFSNYTLERITYIKKKSTVNKEISEYEQYLNEVNRISSKLYINIGSNEQLQNESMPGSKYYQAHALSLLIKFNNNKLGVLRFKFLNKTTSYIDQGVLVSILYTLSHAQFMSEHSSIQHNNKIFSSIDEIIIFREPKIGKVFEKYQYRYSPNYYFLHTLHSKEGIDVSRGDIVENSILVREQEIAFKHSYNWHDQYNSEICYFNYIEFILETEFDFNRLPAELFETVMQTINEYFFDSVTDQQIKMVNMIENQLKNSFTENIKSCNMSPMEIAKKRLKQLKTNQDKGGSYRLKKKDYDLTLQSLKQWITLLKYHKFIEKLKKLKWENTPSTLSLKDYQYHFIEFNKKTRIDPGSGFFYEMTSKDDFCSQYIVNEFATIIPWMNWEDEMYFAKELLKEKIDSKLYKTYKHDLEILLESIFSNKGFLYKHNTSGRAVFYTSIEKQFNDYAKWEERQRKNDKEYSVNKILKTSIIKKAFETLNSFKSHHI